MPDFLIRFRRPISVLLHVALIILANSTAFWLRFDGDVPPRELQIVSALLPWLVLIRLGTFIPFKLFEGLWKYTSLWDLRNIILGVFISTALFYPVAQRLSSGVYPRSIHIIDSILLICLMTGIRLTRRLSAEIVRRQTGRRVLIYGAGDAGELIVRDMRHNSKFQAVPVGFIDDDGRKLGQRIHGVPVLGGRRDLTQIVEKYRPEELLLAIPSASRDVVRSIVRALEPYQIRITTLPKLHELMDRPVEVGQIRQLRLEDLLARDPIGLSFDPLQSLLKDKRIIVTGAGGSIGSELCRQIAAASPEALVLLERYENSLFRIHQEISATFPAVHLRPILADITDAKRIEQVFADVRGHVVFHAAAHKHVPLMEDNPCEAVKNNVRGTRVLAHAARQSGIERFILISTDKAVNPTSVMGASKRIAELIVASMPDSPTRFATVRFGNVLGSNGSVVPTFVEQIAKGGPVTVTHPEVRRFFMLIPEAVQLVLYAAAMSDSAPLFVLEMGEQLKVADLARDLIRLSGLVPDKDIELRFTGLRPGEKMFEELVGPDEYAVPSAIDKILCVRATAARSQERFAEGLMRLETHASDGRSQDVILTLRQLLGDYTTENVEVAPV